MKRELEKLLAQVVRQGFIVTRTKRSHYRCQAPDGRVTFCPSTPSDHRSLLNTRADLRRMGAIL